MDYQLREAGVMRGMRYRSVFLFSGTHTVVGESGIVSFPSTQYDPSEFALFRNGD